jgi:hypothetical protein
MVNKYYTEKLKIERHEKTDVLWNGQELLLLLL